MKPAVLVVSSDPELCSTIQLTLAKTGSYQLVMVGNSQQALERVQKVEFTFCILDITLAEVSPISLGEALTDIRPGIRIIYILPKEASIPDLYLSQIDVNEKFLLTSVDHLVEILESGEIFNLSPSSFHNLGDELGSAPASGIHNNLSKVIIPALESLDWRTNQSTAISLVENLLPEATSHTIILIKREAMWAYVGQLDEAGVTNLISLTDRFWRKPDNNGKEHIVQRMAGNIFFPVEEDLFYFIQASSGSAEYLFYARSLDDEFLLGLVFDSKTPLSQIRWQALQLSEALIVSDRSKDGTFLSRKRDANEIFDRLQSTHKYENVTATHLFVEKEFAELAESSNEGCFSEAGKELDMKPEQHGGGETGGIHGGMQGMISESGLPATFRLPERNFNAITYCRISYICILIPRLPWHKLSGDLSSKMIGWMRHLSLVYGFRLKLLSILPNYMQWICEVTPEMSAAFVIEKVRQSSSLRLFKTFPALAEENPSGDFWAWNYLCFDGSALLDKKTINEFIHHTRMEQGVLFKQHDDRDVMQDQA